MEPAGCMIYGFNQNSAEQVKAAFELAVDREVIIISASAMEEKTVSDVLDAGPRDLFEEKDQGFLMFLGFDQEMVQSAMKAFPDGLSRPIFCGLTENNSTWTIAFLLEHLIEEKTHWEKKKS